MGKDSFYKLLKARRIKGNFLQYVDKCNIAVGFCYNRKINVTVDMRLVSYKRINLLYFLYFCDNRN